MDSTPTQVAPATEVAALVKGLTGSMDEAADSSNASKEEKKRVKKERKDAKKKEEEAEKVRKGYLTSKDVEASEEPVKQFTTL